MVKDYNLGMMSKITARQPFHIPVCIRPYPRFFSSSQNTFGWIWYKANKWSSTGLTCALDDDISLMRSRGASGGRIAVD